jgi:hypothetical protein
MPPLARLPAQWCSNTPELNIVFTTAGSSFAAHFKYGYDTVCKLLEAANCQGDPSLQNGCLHLLSTALGTSGVSPSSHAALKRTLAVVRHIPSLSL